QSWPLMGGADDMDEGGGCGQRAAGRGGGERVGSDVGSWRGRGGGSVLVRGRGRGDDGRGRDARPAMARSRFEMGHDRSGMKLKLLMTGEEDLPRVATVMNVGLRPQRIWNVLVVAVVMNGSDGPSGCSPVVGSDGGKLAFFDGVNGAWRGRRRRRLAGGGSAAW
ncbi:hypothetical protein ACLOJK_024086, partial [Asimina triloba]